MNLALEVEQAVADKALKSKTKKFQEQRDKFRALKDRLDAAGVVYGERYEVPLMSRIGHVVQTDKNA